MVRYQCFSLLLVKTKGTAYPAETRGHLLTFFKLNLQLIVQYDCSRDEFYIPFPATQKDMWIIIHHKSPCMMTSKPSLGVCRESTG